MRNSLRVDQAKRLIGLEEDNAQQQRVVVDLSPDDSILVAGSNGQF
jgi:hypothetical protein